MSTQKYNLSDLLSSPKTPLTPDQREHFEEYMAFQNHDISAKEVSISDAVDDIIANMDEYCGIVADKV